MKTLNLDHPFTPPQLSIINKSLVDHLATDDPDEAVLLQLVKNREEVIQAFLKEHSKEDLKDFAKQELKMNGLLIAYCEKMSKASLKRLSGLVRGRKAVKKYL
ncbi:hypothetical protein [uncultured Paraglaciecola sp.]|uniref:hypothetical protein n=1 Tax=uncultured Paraglaciecola sp. TaxID=1765024 RepID=UPI002591AB78|nr:hypothetical protein [uncultured Paraglaciecola sp.]